MHTRNTLLRALVRFALVAATAGAAAAVWSANRPEQGLLVDAETWTEEVASASTGPWPAEGWYRLLPREGGVEVRAVAPADRDAAPAQALFFRLRGTTLKTGWRAGQAGREQVGEPRPGRYSLRVEEVDAGVQYAIGYGGRTYTYLLGPRGSQTAVTAVADLDGDGRPDFLVDVEGQEMVLLLSGQAQPGANLPTAELQAPGC